MLKRILGLIVGGVFFAGASAQAAWVDISGKISLVRIHNAESAGAAITEVSPQALFVYIAPNPGQDWVNGCGKPNSRVAIHADNPAYESMVSAVLTAKINQMPVKLRYQTTCTANLNSYDLIGLFFTD